MTTPFEDKESLLAAIAQYGSQGADAYHAAQAQLQQQQDAATKAALSGSVAMSPGAQARVQEIIGSGYAPRQAQLTQNSATSADYFAKLGASTSSFYDQARAQVPAIEARLAAQLAAQGGGGGGGGGGSRGGGGGGRGGGKADNPDDWQKNLKALGSTVGYQRAGLLSLAHDPGADRSLPVVLRARKIAQDQFGAPGYAAEQLVPSGGFYKFATDSLQNAQGKNVTYQNFKKQLTQAARGPDFPGSQSAGLSYVLAQAQQTLKNRKKK